MSGSDIKDALVRVANDDSPETINIPNTWAGIAAWLVARLGIGLVIAAVFGFATKSIYMDMRADRAELMKAYVDNTVAMNALANQIKEQNTATQLQMQIQTESVRQMTETVKELIKNSK